MKATKLAAGLAIVTALLAGTATTASAQASNVDVFANPDTVGVGQSTAVTATGLGDMSTATFGLDNTASGSLSGDGSTYASTAEVRANDGNALVYFKASQPGEYVVNVGTGESSLGQTTITVTGEAPATGPQLKATPSSIEAGKPATITATNLGGLGTAGFGLGGGSSGATLEPTTAAVSNGTASTTFTATQPGTYTIDVTDGETPLASIQVTVSAATGPAPAPTAPTPEPTASSLIAPSPAAAPAQETGVPAAVAWSIGVVAALIVAAAIIAAVVVVRRQRRNTTPGA